MSTTRTLPCLDRTRSGSAPAQPPSATSATGSARSARSLRPAYNSGRLFPGAEEGVIAGAAVIFEGDRIAWCGHDGREPRVLMDAVSDDYDCGGGLVTAGLIDAHSHPLYAGDRLAEVAMRAEGRSYTEIAKAGGGIKATVKSTRDGTATALEAGGAPRAGRGVGRGAGPRAAEAGRPPEPR